MASSDISLSSAIRSSLLSLQLTQQLTDRTQERLSSGKKVNTILDNPTAYFRAQGLANRASDFNDRKDEIDQGISVIKAALNGIDSAQSLAEQVAGLAQQAKNASVTDQTSLQNSARSLITQLNNLLFDTSLNGVNLVYDPTNTTYGTQLTVNFSSVIAITVSGTNLTASALGITATAITFDTTNIATSITLINNAITTLKGAGSTFATNVALLQTRLDYTKIYVNTLQEANDKLVLADLNEESANLLALKTRQQLGINSLSLAAQSEQSVLSLFR